MPHPVRPRSVVAMLLLLATAAACASRPAAIHTGAQQAERVRVALRDDAGIMGMLHAANLAEIAAGSQAQALAIDTAVRAFGVMMSAEHSQLDRKGAALSQQLKVAAVLPDTVLSRLQQLEADSLSRSAASFAFDRVYIAQQIVAHERTLGLVDAAIPLAQHAELRAMLQAEVRPVVSAHLARAREIQSRFRR